jgi:hypothetical protein
MEAVNFAQSQNVIFHCLVLNGQWKILEIFSQDNERLNFGTILLFKGKVLPTKLSTNVS